MMISEVFPTHFATCGTLTLAQNWSNPYQFTPTRTDRVCGQTGANFEES
jgi:hypothetical protein